MVRSRADVPMCGRLEEVDVLLLCLFVVGGARCKSRKLRPSNALRRKERVRDSVSGLGLGKVIGNRRFSFIQRYKKHEILEKKQSKIKNKRRLLFVSTFKLACEAGFLLGGWRQRKKK